ncbi:MAG TPA: Wzz/FepE/Etk N-terminal domain-containing protein [Mycobacterium sp.]|nr:Wzz/FepE/Etk N-terminal domain-containing protein [Mycobacterium sp.]
MDYLRIFRRFWWLVVVLTIVGAAAGYITTLFLTPEYSSTARLFVATQNGTSVTEAYQNNLFSQERVNSYAGLATSEQVAARAVDQLKAPISPEDLRAKIAAAPEGKTVLLDVMVTDENPAQAQTYANAVADQLVGLVSELETSRRGGSPAAGVVVVDEASYPTDANGLGFWTILGIGAGAGLIVGLIAAVLWGILDKRLRGRDAVEGTAGTNLIGALPEDSARPRVEVVDLDGNGLYAERVRELRTNLRFAVPPSGRGPVRSLAVTSASSGEGRTTTAIDLAAALAESGRSVVLVEGDLRNPVLADRLTLDPQSRLGAAERGVSTVLSGEHALPQALIGEVAVGAHAIALLPGGPKPPRPGELWANDRAGALFEDLSRGFDYVIVDTPPLGTYADGANVGALCDGVLLLSRIGRTTSASLRRAIHSLQAANVNIIGPVATFDRVSMLSKRQHRKQVEQDAAANGGQRSSDDSRGGGGSADDTAVIGSQEGQLVGTGGQRRPRARHGSN